MPPTPEQIAAIEREQQRLINVYLASYRRHVSAAAVRLPPEQRHATEAIVKATRSKVAA